MFVKPTLRGHAVKNIPAVILLLSLCACALARDPPACRGHLRPINTPLQEHDNAQR